MWLEIADAQVTTPEQVEIEPEVLAEIINKHLRLAQSRSTRFTRAGLVGVTRSLTSLWVQGLNCDACVAVILKKCRGG